MLWKDHVAKWRNCKLCNLCHQRYKIVIGKGDKPCDIAFIGEAPSENENLIGQPFVGPAGELLDRIIEKAQIKKRLAFTNLVCCFPAEAKETNNHQPRAAEIRACRARLTEFIDIFSPKMIVAVGSLADDHIPVTLGADVIVNAGGRVEGHATVERLISIVHPSYILSRMPTAQKGMACHKAAVQISNAVDAVDWD